MANKFYIRNITEGKNFLIVSIILSIILKGLYIIHPKVAFPEIEGVGYLWQPLAAVFENPIYSIAASCISIFLIAFLVNLINSKHALIRKRTLLPSAIAILLFSCSPLQLAMSPSYFGTLTMLLVVDCLFQVYNSDHKQISAFKASFYLTLGSLFTPVLLIYFPILWLCLIKMRCLNFKSFLASLFSIAILYIPVFSYYLLVAQDVDSFLKPFLWFGSIDWKILPILNYGMYGYIVLGIATLLITSILIDNSINAFNDKIRVRAFLAVLMQISLFSLLCVLLLNFNSYTQLPFYIALAVGSLQIGHFFSLAKHRLTPYAFYILLVFIIVINFIFI